MPAQVRGDFGVAAKVVDMLQLPLRRLHVLAQQGQCLQRGVQPLLAFGQAVLQQHRRVCATRAGIQLGRVDRHGVLDFFEQVLVIDDVAKVFIVAVQPVGAANGLEQAMILHRFVDVQIGARRRVKTCEQLVHHDQQLHVGRLFDEQGLGPFFIGFG